MYFQQQLMYVQTSTTYKNTPPLHKLENPITNSVFLYIIFTDKTYARTRFKIFITDYLFLTFYDLTFNPTSEKLKLRLSSSIRFHVPVFTLIAF